MGRVRTEASVGLALAWNPCGPIDERDVSVLRRFLAAVRELACRGQLRVAGDISLLDRAIRVGDVSVADLPVESGLTRLETQEKHLIITVLGTITVIGVCIAVDVGWASGRSTTAVGTTDQPRRLRGIDIRARDGVKGNVIARHLGADGFRRSSCRSKSC